MPANVKIVNEQVLRNIVLNAFNKLENKKKLDEQLINVICDSKTKSDVKLKKVKYLIRLGANVNARKDGISALSWARKSKEEEIAKYLEDNGGKEWVAPFGKEWFSKIGEDFVDTVFSGSTKEVIKEILVKSKSYLDIALMCIVEDDMSVVVEQLLKRGFDVNRKDDDGCFLLMAATEEGDEKVVKMLLENGADIELRDKKGRSALILAASLGRVKVVEMLLDRGADVFTSHLAE